MGLNHMNGRVQDAISGRFISPDPFVTEPGNTQNWNRYAYVYNNPLTYIDPSGFEQRCWQQQATVSFQNAPNEVTAVGITIDICAELPDIPAPNYSGSTQGPHNGGGGGDQGGGSAEGGRQEPCNEALISAGNALVRPANTVADAGFQIATAGTLAAIGGVASRNPRVTAIGVAMADTGAATGYIAGGMQLMAGVLQSAGGADNDNAFNAIVTMGQSALLARAIKGPARTTDDSFSQRTLRTYFNRVSANAGYIYDIAKTFIEGLGPKTATCTRAAGSSEGQ